MITLTISRRSYGFVASLEDGDPEEGFGLSDCFESFSEAWDFLSYFAL